MSKNNQIKKSDKKFIRREKARIRAKFYDAKKQEELISALYQRFLATPLKELTSEQKPEAKQENKEPKVKKAEVKANPKKKEVHPVKSAESGVSLTAKQFNGARKEKPKKNEKKHNKT